MQSSTALGHHLLIPLFHPLLLVLLYLRSFPFMLMMVSLSAIPCRCIHGSFLNFKRPWKLWIWDQLRCTLVIVLRVIVLVANFGFRRSLIVLSFSGLGTCHHVL